jgi:hypothetical protein
MVLQWARANGLEDVSSASDGDDDDTSDPESDDDHDDDDTADPE